MSRHNNKENLVNKFIDDLNDDKKPQVYVTGEFESEDEMLFETIRSIKRNIDAKDMKSNSKNKRKVLSFIKQRKMKFSFAAASIFIVFSLVTGLFQLPGNNQGINIVHALQQAYSELESYTGTTVITGYKDGEIEYYETIDIHYKKPWKYKAVHNFDETVVSYYSNGSKLITEYPNSIEVENVFPEKDLWRYHIGTPIWELNESDSYTELGTEKVLGRDAHVIQYNYAVGEYNTIWIDAETNLPLKKELTIENDSRSLVVEFKNLQVNPQIDDVIFDYVLDENNENVRVFNQTSSIDELKDLGHEKADDIVKAMPDNYEIFTVGYLDQDMIFDYVLRFKGQKEKDFIDVYYSSSPMELRYTRDSILGKLGSGYVVIDEDAVNVMETYIGFNTAGRWNTENEELFIVTNSGSADLIKIMEDIAADKMEEVTIKEIEDIIQEHITKENH